MAPTCKLCGLQEPAARFSLKQKRQCDSCRFSRLARRRQAPPPPGHKTCTHCAETKPLPEFYVSVIQGKAKTAPMCRDCYSKHDEASPESRVRGKAKRKENMRRAGPGFITNAALKAAEPGGCEYCDGPHETIDHMIPISRNGTNALGNLVRSCKRCNYSKHDRTPEEWVAFLRIAYPDHPFIAKYDAL